MKVTVWHRQGLFDLAPGTQYVPIDLIDQLSRGYRPGDRIKPVYDYDAGPCVTADDVSAVAEQACRMFNDQAQGAWEQEQAERYYAAGNRSLSVGDVLVVGEMALSCEPLGWEFVSIPTQAAG
jgi:hypothetical protein